MQEIGPNIFRTIVFMKSHSLWVAERNVKNEQGKLQKDLMEKMQLRFLNFSC